jgi:hypothetical protein
MSTQRFYISFDRSYGILSSLLLLRPADSYLEINEKEVYVKMGWAFRSRFPKSAVTLVEETNRHPLSRGVHGFAGRWLVNGSGQGIVSIILSPTQRGYVMGFPVRLRQLLVSMVDPAVLVETLK